MTDTLINFFTETLAGLPKELIIFIISMVPVLELRGGIVAASLLGVSIVKAIPICIIGNIIPIPFIMLFIEPIFRLLKKTKLMGKIVEKIEKKSLEKSDRIKEYEFWGLLLFVGIPLPGTGAWTGSLIAVLLEIKPKKAVLPIFLGLILATVIMCVVSYLIPWIIKSI